MPNQIKRNPSMNGFFIGLNLTLSLIFLSSYGKFALGSTGKTPGESGKNTLEVNKIVDDRDLFSPAEQMPSFPGGESELMSFLNKNIHYPKMSKELGITGIVFIEFTVETDGTMNNVKIVKGVSSDIDKEALRLVGLMPKWTPGSQRNQPVQVEMRLPIRFTLM